MKYSYEFHIFGSSKRIKSSLSTKVILSAVDGMMYCQQKGLDMQMNPGKISLYCIDAGRYVYRGSSLVNSERELTIC